MYEEVGNYVILGDQRLGAGSFGEAFKCYRKDNRNVEYCIKIIRKSINVDPKKEEKQKKQLEAEINTFKMLQQNECENLVKMIDFIDGNSKLCIIMELCEYDLSKELYLLKSLQKWPSVLEIVDMIKQILNGAQVLIQNNIIHRDIKPQNILVQILNKGTPKERKIYKIADFGFTKYLDDIYAKANLTRVGTRSYCAPEIMKGDKFSCKCDIYSYGIVFHQIVYQMEYPGNYVTEPQLREFLNKIQTNPHKCKSIQGQYGDLITTLIERMLLYDQDKRISFDELLTHKIMKMPFRIQNDSMFLPIERTIKKEEQEQQMQRNETERFQRLHLLITIYYRKYLLCKKVVDFMKQINVIDQIQILIFQQLIQLIGYQEIIYGFAMMNCIISDLEPAILNDNDVPQLIELLNQFIRKSTQNKEYQDLQINLKKDYYQAKDIYKQDLNKLYCVRAQINSNQFENEFKFLQKSKTKKIPVQECCQVLQALSNNIQVNEWINKCDDKIKQYIQTIKTIDKKFSIEHYRMINPDDILEI